MTPLPFDVRRPLPTGTSVLEASAGTGKTHTIASVAVRYVAEGEGELRDVLAVTFGRAATHELRDRIRARFQEVERALSDPVTARTSSDPLVAHLAGPGIADRRDRLAAALADFDAATITTIHGFCQQALTSLGVLGDLDPGASFVQTLDELVGQATADTYVRHFAGRDPARAEAVPYQDACTVAAAAVGDAQAVLVPQASDILAAADRVALAAATRSEVARRKRSALLVDFDDLLVRLRDALVDPVRGDAVRRRLRSAYRLVLVDEFQDTDPVQWDLFSAAFGGSDTAMVLIGDPKQAIYSFRGGDLHTYLKAVRAASEPPWQLPRNWRSDADLVSALDALLGGASLGSPEIVVRRPDAEHPGSRIRGVPAPLRLRVVGVNLTADRARAVVRTDLARQVVGMLGGASEILTEQGSGRPVVPADIAVVVRTNREADLVRAGLIDASVPCVVLGDRSVFAGDAARQWRTLLAGVLAPHRPGLVRAAALTPFVGWDAGRLDSAADADLDALAQRLQAWSEVWDSSGVAALTERLTDSGEVLVRLLSGEDGVRGATDARHVASLLHGASVRGSLGPSALLQWLEERIEEALPTPQRGTRPMAGRPDPERIQRLDTDADAVQILTVHRAKGLQFPIVLVPFAWTKPGMDGPDTFQLHAADGTRLLDVGGSGDPGEGTRRTDSGKEQVAEDLRTLYVALTRAESHVVAWWARYRDTCRSPLHRVLARHDDGTVPDVAPTLAQDAERRLFEALVDRSSGTVAIEAVDVPVAPARWSTPPPTEVGMSVRRWDRPLDGAWRRVSYTALTRSSHEVRANGQEREPVERDDEAPVGAAVDEAAASEAPDVPDRDGGARDVPAPEPDAAPTQVPPMADLPRGTAFGTLVHHVLEHTDTTAPDLRAEVRSHCVAAARLRPGAAPDPDRLADGIVAALATPLGPLAGDVCLRDVAPGDRLAELTFELPLAGGDTPRGTSASLRDVADLLRSHLPATDPLAAYGDRLTDGTVDDRQLRGYLTGSVDAVLRLGGGTRYLVVDYKTNWLGDVTPDGTARSKQRHYRPDALAVAMIEAHYPLQALLYLVALHRFLRWRQPAYDPAQHLGGVLYLFVRGMTGADTPRSNGQPHGVFAWNPPAALVTDLSELLDGERP